MSVTREQVADLQAGDVVELGGHPMFKGATVTGPLWINPEGDLVVGNNWTVRYALGHTNLTYSGCMTLRVISRAPRPLYVNHLRTEAVPGDVVRGTQIPGVEPGTWTYTFNGWVSTRSGSPLCLPPRPARLLVDGATGQVVP